MSRTLLRTVWAWGPPLVLAGFIFWSSHQTDPGPELSWELPHLDKLVHAAIYGLLALLLYRALGLSQPQRPRWSCALLALLLTVGYGISDEVHQSFVPGRQADPLDLAADALGAIVVVGAVALLGSLGDSK